MIKDNTIILIEDLTKLVGTPIRKWYNKRNDHVEGTKIRARKWYGNHTEETKRKMSVSQKLRWLKRKEGNDTNNRI